METAAIQSAYIRVSDYPVLMKSDPKPSPEYEKFSGMLNRVLSVPRSVLQARLEAEKAAKNKGQPKQPSKDREETS
jgi:hypothetical protein